MNAMTAAQIAVITSAAASLGIQGDFTFQFAGYTPVTMYQPPKAQPANDVSPVYHVSNKGLDSNPGTEALPWKTPRAVSNATVMLASELFVLTTPIRFNGLVNAVLTSSASNPAVLLGPAAAAGAVIGPNILTWWDDSTNCTLSNVIIDSIDGKGFGGNIRGKNIAINNVLLKNLTEGFDWHGVDGVILAGGGQVGTVQGRCHYFLGCRNFAWAGDPARVFGPAVGQSPIRFSTEVGGRFVNNSGGTIAGVSVTQAGSPDPIAAWAIHNAMDLVFSECTAVAGEFSLDGAGAGVGDVVRGCTIDNLVIANSKLNLQSVAFNNVCTNLLVTNPTGEAVSVQTAPKAGNAVSGYLVSPVHGVHFYAAGDTVFKNCTYDRQGKAGAPFMDGLVVAANDGGGNVVK